MAVRPVNTLAPLRTPDYAQALFDDMDKEVEVTAEEGISTPTEDGGMVIDFASEKDRRQDAMVEAPHGANLAELMDDSDLSKLAGDLINDVDEDTRARADWYKAYSDGLELLGLKVENRTMPWNGAAGVFHPVLTEAVVRFQAEAMGELFPATGPAKGSVIGVGTPDILKRAKRVEDEVNYFCVQKMVEYRSEMEMMLFSLPLAGCAFKKVYLDPIKKRPVALFVPAEDVVVPYGVSDIRESERVTHIQKKTKNEVRKLQLSGFYRDCHLPDPVPIYTNVQNKKDKLTGERPTVTVDERYELLELHIDLDLEGFEHRDEEGEPTGLALPYVITIEKGSSKVLSIYRNWVEEDPDFKRRQHLIAYHYLPGLGFYGIGLIGLIGGLAKASTSILRQLIDAGTLANLPIGFKAKGLRVKTGDNPFRPGEFRDIDVPASSIRDSLYQIQVKEPSTVLFQLMQNVVDEARRVGSVADLKIGDMQAGAPVGTTLALLERALKVTSGVKARNHASLDQELKLIADMIGALPGNYEYDVGGDFSRQEDFGPPVDVVPVSDPNASTMAQRVMQYQAAMEMSQRQPEIYDMPKLHQQMLLSLGIKEASDIVKVQDEMIPMDPVSENMAILTMKPVKAFLYQDHEAHITSHMSMVQDPQIMAIAGQSPNAPAMQAALAAHVAEHVAMQYRAEIEEMIGVQLPPPNEPLPEDVEAKLSNVSAQAGTKLLEKHKAEAANQKAKEIEEDPIYQLEKQKVQIQGQEVQRKTAKDASDDRFRKIELLTQSSLKATEIAAESGQTAEELQIEREFAQIQAAVEKLKLRHEAERAKISLAQQAKSAQINVGAARAQAHQQEEAGRSRMEIQRRSDEQRLESQKAADAHKLEQQRELGRAKVQAAKAMAKAKPKAKPKANT